MIHDLYLRAHTTFNEKSEETEEKQPRRRKRAAKLWPDYALVWDTETTLDLGQTLNFGVWRFCELRRAEYVAVQEGVFYHDGLSRHGVQTILAYKRKHSADDVAGTGNEDLVVVPRAKFVERIFWEAVQAGALIVGFNLPFDISRIAVRWATAQNGGFSFVLSHLDKKQVENHHRPRIRVAPLNGVAERIELTAVRHQHEQDKWRRGRFLDLHALVFALTDNSYSLAGAIEAFASTPPKMEHEPTGQITSEELAYARQDVRATLGLLTLAVRSGPRIQTDNRAGFNDPNDCRSRHQRRYRHQS